MYTLTNTGNVQRVADGAFIPSDTGNADYLAYLDWLAHGNTPTGPTVAAPVIDPNLGIQAQIDAIERTTMVPRVIREFLLASAELEAGRQVQAQAAAGVTVTADYLLSRNAGYVKTKQVDNQIKHLRSQLV